MKEQSSLKVVCIQFPNQNFKNQVHFGADCVGLQVLLRPLNMAS